MNSPAKRAQQAGKGSPLSRGKQGQLSRSASLSAGNPGDLHLRERLKLDTLEDNLKDYLTNLQSLGYKSIEFKIVRPYVELHLGF